MLLAPAAILVGQVLAPDNLAVVPVATAFGVLAARCRSLGLIRWPYLVPYLSRTYNDPAASDATREAVAVVFQSFHRILGVAIGEHLGYLFTGLWTLLIGFAMTDSASLQRLARLVRRCAGDRADRRLRRSSRAHSRIPGGAWPGSSCRSPTSCGRSGWWPPV